MSPEEIMIKTALKAWDFQVAGASRVFGSFSDEEMQQEVAPGKNRAIYLLGHLIAYHDLLNRVFYLGERAYKHYDDLFLMVPDQPQLDFPSVATLRKDWIIVHQELAARFATLSISDWLARYGSTTDGEFEKDPLKNKLSLLLSRTIHLAYHQGQLKLLVK